MTNEIAANNFSMVDLKVKLHALVRNGVLDHRIAQILLPLGTPLAFERELWDYKLKQPTQTKGNAADPNSKAAIDREWANTVKDVIAFYNSYGGYIIFGISDSPKKVVGYTGEFDVDELNKRVTGYSKVLIECSFQVLSVAVDDTQHDIGVLHIPQRADTEHITVIRKDGPQDGNGKPLFPKGTIYLRKSDSCTRAEEPEDFHFLTSAGRRSLSFATAKPLSTPTLNHNLPPRDPSFMRFIGRDADTVSLWNWFLDEHSPLRLVAGLGGIGKTTLVREFTEDVVRTSPSGVEKVVWLSAKEAVYTAIQGKYHRASRVDFTDVNSLLKAILLELGELDATINELSDADDLLETLTANLTHIPVLLVVDDLDSLPLDLQQEAFHAVLQAFTQATAKSGKPAKCIITARLDLGASPSQLVRVRGLALPDFAEFVKETAHSIDLQLNFGGESQLMRRFHSVTDGSPTFASAVLRLIAIGESIENALTRWKGSDGEEVRRFAFERELNNLTDSQIRTLYAASVLGECYLDELIVILGTNQSMLKDCIADLRKYHLMSSGAASAQGVSLVVPASLQLMRDIVRKRVQDPKRIDDECARIRSQSKNRSQAAMRITQRVVALWQMDDPEPALDVAIQGVKENPEVGDLHCLLGRAYLRVISPNYRLAEIAFRTAKSFDCRRSELLQLWIEAKYGLSDWKGILDITESEIKKPSTPSEIYIHRATACRELAKTALSAGDSQSAGEWLKSGGDEISGAFITGKAVGNVQELKELKFDFFSEYVFLKDRQVQGDADHLDVWLAVSDSFDAFVRKPALLRLGFSRLLSWWVAVMRRDNFDQRALNLIELQLRKARAIRNTQAKFEGSQSSELISFMDDCLNSLGAKVSEYGERLS